jgi:fumarate hydratase class II
LVPESGAANCDRDFRKDLFMPKSIKRSENGKRGSNGVKSAKAHAGTGEVKKLVAGKGTRIEKDSMGEMLVPADVLYGASTQRAVLNFPVSGQPVPTGIITAYAMLKRACAQVNLDLGRLSGPQARNIFEACDQIAAGLKNHGGIAKHFPVDVFQTGSGTSTNMNANEVIANLVCLKLRKPIGSSKDPAYLKIAGAVHPNDHVNMGQSSNDTFPTAMHIAAALAIHDELLPAVQKVAQKLEEQAAAWDSIVKIGRTHLQDATPIRLGQEFGGYASQMWHAMHRLESALESLAELPIGGTAVGTGINAHEEFGKRVSAALTEFVGQRGVALQAISGIDSLHFREADNHFEAQHAKDACVEVSGLLKTIAVSASKIANDIRWLGSGPRCGLGELVLPAVQPGSSIMPGKVNPVICESLIQVCCQVIGNDAAVTLGGLGGVGSLLDLNVAMPMMARNLLESIHLLAAALNMFHDNLLVGLKPDEKRCKDLIEGSLAMCTSLVPVIGYDASAALAKEAYAQGKTIRALASEKKLLSKDKLDALLDPHAMTLPGGEGSAGG